MTEDETSHINIELTQSLDGSLHDILPERRANSILDCHHELRPWIVHRKIPIAKCMVAIIVIVSVIAIAKIDFIQSPKPIAFTQTKASPSSNGSTVSCETTFSVETEETQSGKTTVVTALDDEVLDENLTTVRTTSQEPMMTNTNNTSMANNFISTLNQSKLHEETTLVAPTSSTLNESGTTSNEEMTTKAESAEIASLSSIVTEPSLRVRTTSSKSVHQRGPKSIYEITAQARQAHSSNPSNEPDLIHCFKKGDCKGGHFLHLEKRENVSDCMKRCQSNVECQWATFDLEFQFCTLLSSCPRIDAAGCPDCVTSFKSCPLNVPCNSTGRCKGSILDLEITKHRCHTKCREDDMCNWYSYGNNVCLVFHACTQINSTFSNYTTQHSTCPELNLKKLSYLEKYKDAVISPLEKWKSYIIKKVIGDVNHVDCGLYCEEYEPCDFFAQTSHNCYLGTFRNNDTHEVVFSDSDNNYVYLMPKQLSYTMVQSKYEDFELDVPIAMIGKNFVYSSRNLSHFELCPVVCLIEERCGFYVALETQGTNCYLGNFQSHERRESSLLTSANRPFTFQIKKGTEDPMIAIKNSFGQQGRHFGPCRGTGIHLFGQVNKVNFYLDYADNYDCTFVIWKWSDDSEENYDFLRIYSGSEVSGTPLKIYTGRRGRISYEWTLPCVTLNWRTDGSGTKSTMGGIIEEIRT